MEFFKIKGDADGKIYKLLDDYDVSLKITHSRYEEYKSETHYILANIDDGDDIITVPISETLLHE